MQFLNKVETEFIFAVASFFCIHGNHWLKNNSDHMLLDLEEKKQRMFLVHLQTFLCVCYGLFCIFGSL